MLLPFRYTLRAYIGRSTGEVGVTKPICQRLKVERENLFENEHHVSLEIDERAIFPKSTFIGQLGRMIGEENYGGILKQGKIRSFWQTTFWHS